MQECTTCLVGDIWMKPTKKSRVLATKKNVMFGVTFQLLTLIMTFVGRYFFIHKLGNSYLGLDGLFKNILSMLSFTELGIGVAITSSLYKPLAESDYVLVKSLVSLLKKIYLIMVIIIIFSGSILTLFLPFFIKGIVPDGTGIAFVVYFMNSAASYFLVANRSLLIADQNGYLNAYNQFVFNMVAQVAQIITLFIFNNYVVYLLVLLISTVLSNITLNRTVKKKYPILDNVHPSPVPKEIKKDLLQNVTGMISSKLGGIILNSTDNLVLSYFVGLSVVGIYSNYLIVVNGLTTLLNTGISALTASIGNLGTEKDTIKEERTFYQLFLGNSLLIQIISFAMIIFLPHFISVWVGSEYRLSLCTTFAIVFLFFLNQLRQISISFQIAHSLFWQQRYKSIFEAVSNLVISIILVKYFHLGVLGVVLGTISSNFLVNSWWEPLIVFKSGLKVGLRHYYLLFIIEIIAELLLLSLGMYVSVAVHSIIIKIIIFTAMMCFLIIITYFSSKDFKNFIHKIFRS